MRTEEAYTELSVQLARIEAKVDKILSVLVKSDEVDSSLSFTPDITYTSDVIKAKDEALNRLVKIYEDTKQEDSFNNPNPPKSVLDAAYNPPPVFNAQITETI